MTEELKIVSADVSTWGRFQGKDELVKHLNGGKIAKWQAVKAKCYDCMGGYSDGAMDCEVFRCPLYPFMPYKGKKLTTSQLLRLKAPK
jgi:hypothetical protein